MSWKNFGSITGPFKQVLIPFSSSEHVSIMLSVLRWHLSICPLRLPHKTVNIRIWLEGTLMELAKKVVCAFNAIFFTGKGSVGKTLVFIKFSNCWWRLIDHESRDTITEVQQIFLAVCFNASKKNASWQKRNNFNSLNFIREQGFEINDPCLSNWYANHEFRSFKIINLRFFFLFKPTDHGMIKKSMALVFFKLQL